MTVKRVAKKPKLHDDPEWDRQRIAVRKSVKHPGDPKDPHAIDCPCFGDYDSTGKRVIHAKECKNCECRVTRYDSTKGK